MRKMEPGLWVDRWSPRREEISNDDELVNTGNGEQPIITFPSDDNSD